MNIFVQILFYGVILVVSITIHEFCHAWAGHLLGDVTAKREGRLTLNPVAHIDPFLTLILPIGLILLGSPVVFGAAKPVPFNPYAVRHGKAGAAMVAFAGPLSNIVMAAIIGVYLRIFDLSGLGGVFLTQFVLVNVAFFVFNMLPIPPLDGSRLVYAIAPPALMDFMDKVERYGMVVIFVFLFIMYRFFSPLFSSVVLGIASFFIGRPVL